MATILVVDDEFGIAEVLDALLVDAGHQVARAANGRQGLERLRERKPDLILLDVMMPVMDGPAMLLQLRATPAYADLPVIIMSSLPEVSIHVGAAYQAFLHKPFRAREIFDLVARLIPAA
jgi:CheY-like chemotaxis protein